MKFSTFTFERAHAKRDHNYGIQANNEKIAINVCQDMPGTTATVIPKQQYQKLLEIEKEIVSEVALGG